MRRQFVFICFCLLFCNVFCIEYGEESYDENLLENLKNLVQALEKSHAYPKEDIQEEKSFDNLGDADNDYLEENLDDSSDDIDQDKDVSKRYYMRVKARYCTPFSPCMSSRGHRRWANCVCPGKSRCRSGIRGSRCL